MIVPASTAQSLAAALAGELDEPLATPTFDRFPDGELMTSVSGLGNDDPVPERAVVVAATVSSDAHLEVLQLQDALAEAGVERVVTVLSYMGYGRQEKAFESGQPVSARAVARAISTGTDRVLTVTPHEEAVCEYFDVPASAVDGETVLAEPLARDLEQPLFLAPDEGAVELAETVRAAYPGDGAVDHFVKTRHSPTEVTVEPRDTAVAGRDVVIVDDEIATGGTMSEAVRALHDRDVARVFACCVHPLLVGNAVTRLANAGVADLFGTDTIERAQSRVSVAPVIAETL